MGNSESTSDDTPDYLPHQHFHAGSSLEPNSRTKQQATHIADNYSSVEEVRSIVLKYI